MAVYNPNLLVEMECPVCTDYMHPPIRQCSTGHSFCDTCYDRLNQCATCRQPLNGIARNFSLEKLHAKLIFPCKNRDVGCCQIDIGINILKHETICSFGSKECPLKVINDCQWRGRTKDIIDHCKVVHPNNMFCTNRQKLTCSNFLRNPITSSSYFFILFYVYDVFFKCAWDVNFDTGLMRWCVFLMNEPEHPTSFSYEIEIKNQNNTKEGICVRGPCPILNEDFDDSEIFNNTQFMFTHYDMIRTFCKNSDLIYTVKIKSDRLDEFMFGSMFNIC